MRHISNLFINKLIEVPFSSELVLEFWQSLENN
jgi:hypothetical protein